MRKLTKPQAVQAVLGGAILGGGGGGLLNQGMEAAEQAFSYTDALMLLDPDDLPDTAVVANVSTLGAPSAFDAHLTPEHWKTALKDFTEACGCEISGFTSCENGAASTANGWLLSALTGIPLVDAPSNGRAHPTGTMGSIGLNTLNEYVSIQASCGGREEKYTEVTARGALASVSHVIRQSAVAAGGMTGVVRNPVSVSYLKKHAAVGAISYAIRLGKLYQEAGREGMEALLTALKKEYDARLLIRGTIEQYAIKMQGGYDVGTFTVRDRDHSQEIQLMFWNEFMTAEGEDGTRLATFPDLIFTLDAENGEVVSTAQASDGRDIYALIIPKAKLILGAGMHQKALFEEAEAVTGKSLTGENQDLFNC